MLENYNTADFMLLCENGMNFDIKSDEIADTMCDYFVAGKVEAEMKNLISLFTWDKKNKEFISQMMKDRMDIEWL